MNTSQKRAVETYRTRLADRGLARFEVLGAPADRALIRSIARRLADEGPAAVQLRASLARAVDGEPPMKGGIVAALLGSPLVGSDLDLSRPFDPGREIEL